MRQKEKVTQWIIEQERQYPRCTIKALRSDRGGEFLGDMFRAWLTSKGILQDLACRYSPEMNGKAERMNRTLSEMARCMLIGSGLPKKYWSTRTSMQPGFKIDASCLRTRKRLRTNF